MAAATSKPKSALAQALASGASNGQNKIASGSSAYFGFGTGAARKVEPPFEDTSGKQLRRDSTSEEEPVDATSSASFIRRLLDGLRRNTYLVLLACILMVWCAVNIEGILVQSGFELDPSTFEAKAIAGPKSFGAEKSSLILNAFADHHKSVSDKGEKMPLTAGSGADGTSQDKDGTGSSVFESGDGTGGSYGTATITTGNARFNRVI